MKASEQNRKDVADSRIAWQLFQKGLDASRFVFIDETGAKTNMTRLYGRALTSERCNDHAPDGRWESTTIIGSIRLDGTTACMSIDGPTTSDIFQIYVDKILSPQLKPRDIVVLDNLAAHKRQSTLDIIKSKGALVLFLPPYSPDFNPIEKMWSKVKIILREIKARTIDELDLAISAALAKVTFSDAIGWIRSCGYSIN